MKKIIGITGGIGSGKSTVAKFIEEMKFPIYNSDIRAKEIVNVDAYLKEQIRRLLGDEAYDKNGTYNRRAVAAMVFQNDDLLQKLNAIIHPAVKDDFIQWTDRQDTEYIFKETALLFELQLNRDCYKTILVTADDNLRIKRVMDRDEKTYREVETIIQKQMPEKDKIKLADFIIYNNGDLDFLKDITVEIIAELIVLE